MSILKISSCILTLVTLHASCQMIDEGVSDVIVASIYNRELYQSDLEKVLPPNIHGEDSIAYVDTYIDRWLREQSVLVEAEKYIAADINIDRLVEDYRSSLLTYTYEKRLVEDQLDTVITKEAYQTYYEQVKEQFILAEPLVLFESFKIPSKAKRIDRFFSDWRNGREEKIKTYIEENSEDYTLDSIEYIPINIVLNLLPDKFKKQEFKSKKRIQHYEDGYEYFVKVIDYIDSGEVAPLSYIRENLKKRILYDRKNTLILSIKENLYNIAVQSDKVIIKNRRTQ